MALPFFESGARKKRDQMVAVDLGNRTTKAVCVQRRGNSFALTNYVLLDAPIFDKTLSPEMLTEHLKTLSQTMASKSKMGTLTIGLTDALVRPVDMPVLPAEEMRMIRKVNSANGPRRNVTNDSIETPVLNVN